MEAFQAQGLSLPTTIQRRSPIQALHFTSCYADFPPSPADKLRSDFRIVGLRIANCQICSSFLLFSLGVARAKTETAK
ncbi:hypothetical protein BDV12DRAFT_162395 [Aspergillus spectabilis]